MNTPGDPGDPGDSVHLDEANHNSPRRDTEIEREENHNVQNIDKDKGFLFKLVPPRNMGFSQDGSDIESPRHQVH